MMVVVTTVICLRAVRSNSSNGSSDGHIINDENDHGDRF